MEQIARKRINRVIVFTILGALLGMIAGYISTLLDASGLNDTFFITAVGIVLGLILGLQFGFLEEFIWRPISKRVNFINFSILQFCTYLLLIIFWLIIVISLEHVLNDNLSFYEGMLVYLTEEDLLRDIIFATIMTVVLIVIGKLRMLNSSKEILSFFTGKYYYPEQETRVIMFVDIIGSTTFAEQLGAIKYSNFIKDYFSDISESIYAWHGTVYQYVGDGIIISWNGISKYSNGNAVSCYFNMKKAIEDKKNYYISTYNVVPRFRAGIHRGEVIITWVGEVRKELAFHGDTINTAARIQSMCKEYNSDLLVSGELMEEFSLPSNLQAHKLADVVPRGKFNSIEIFNITQR